MRCTRCDGVLFGLGLALVLPALGGCAAPCARVKQAHAEITQRTSPAAAGDHLRLALPMSLINVVLSRELRGIPRVPVPLPAIQGVSLGSAAAGIDRVEVVPGPPSQVAFKVTVSLRSGSQVLLPIELTGRVRPRLEPKRGQVVLALDKRGLVAMDAKLGRGGARKLADALWGRLPAAARMLTSKGQLANLVQPVANELLARASALVQRELLDDLGKVARVELDLPPLPVDAIQVRSTKRDLIVGFHTSLPSRGAIPQALRRTAPEHQVQLTLHAAAAVELVNAAMARGEAPGRFGLDGAAADDGPLQAHLAWAGDAAKPLVVHAFLLDPRAAGRPAKDCAHITLGATPIVGTEQGRLVLSTRDAKIDDVTGSVAVKAGLFFGGVSRRSFEHVEHVAADTEFELGGQMLRATLENAALRGNHLVMGLALSPKKRR